MSVPLVRCPPPPVAIWPAGQWTGIESTATVNVRVRRIVVAVTGPVGPVAPGGPCAPSLPFVPAGPRSPAAPARPRSPALPGGPTGPGGPTNPAGPATPGGPCAPRRPRGPRLAEAFFLGLCGALAASAGAAATRPIDATATMSQLLRMPLLLLFPERQPSRQRPRSSTSCTASVAQRHSEAVRSAQAGELQVGAQLLARPGDGPRRHARPAHAPRAHAVGEAPRAARRADDDPAAPAHPVPGADLARLVLGVRRGDQPRPARRREHGEDPALAPLALLHAPAPHARPARRRLPGRAQQRLVGRVEHHAPEPARGEPRARRLARLHRHAVRSLPHLEAGLGAAAHVVDDLVAGDLAQVLDPVGIQPVVRDAVLVDVEDALAAALAVEGDLAVEGLEGIDDGVGRALPRPALVAEAVHVRPVPEAVVEARVALLTQR